MAPPRSTPRRRIKKTRASEPDSDTNDYDSVAPTRRLSSPRGNGRRRTRSSRKTDDDSDTNSLAPTTYANSTRRTRKRAQRSTTPESDSDDMYSEPIARRARNRTAADERRRGPLSTQSEPQYSIVSNPMSRHLSDTVSFATANRNSTLRMNDLKRKRTQTVRSEKTFLRKFMMALFILCLVWLIGHLLS